MKRLYAWKPDLPDVRDHVFARSGTVPLKVARLGLGNPIENQGQVGSCTGNSSTSALEIVMKSNVPLSRLFAYYNGRALEVSNPERLTDSGAYIRDVIKGLFKLGVADESAWPYVERKVNTKPSAAAYSIAASLRDGALTGYHYARVADFRSLQLALAAGYPVVFGFSVTQAFEDYRRGQLLKVPGPKDKLLGGHAVMACGYDMTVKDPYVWVRNSWGADWGYDGYFRMSTSWFTDRRRLVDDLWVIRKAG